MDDPLSDTLFSDAKRSVNRDSFLLTAVLRFPNTQEERPVRIRNLSAGGLERLSIILGHIRMS